MSTSTPAILLLWTLKFLLVLLTAALSRRLLGDEEDVKKRVQIVVLGDIGRSPRMQYHALSIAKSGGFVDLIGYQDSRIHPEIARSNNIKILPLPSLPSILSTSNRVMFVVLGPVKAVLQVWALWGLLYFKTSRTGWMLVQNPPSIPTLAVCSIICRLRETRLIVDWHNFGYTILALKLGRRHPLVLVSGLYEAAFSHLAHAHIGVTTVMARHLKKNFRITAPVLTLHDRPTSMFQPLNEVERLDFLDELILSFTASEAQRTPCQINAVSSLGPESGSGTVQSILEAIKGHDARLLVSSTSWTPDEDFSFLLHALVGYCRVAQDMSSSGLPILVVIITGSGPGKTAFEADVRRISREGGLSHTAVFTAYFDNVEDYASLLGSADLGISLHTSSSGVDLPMKVLDMFGAGLPVVGWSDFEAWPELVQEGHNGLGFTSASQLQKIFQELFGSDSGLWKKLRKAALKEGQLRWEDEWKPVCGHLLGLNDAKQNRNI